MQAKHPGMDPSCPGTLLLFCKATQPTRAVRVWRVSQDTTSHATASADASAFSSIPSIRCEAWGRLGGFQRRRGMGSHGVRGTARGP